MKPKQVTYLGQDKEEYLKVEGWKGRSDFGYSSSRPRTTVEQNSAVDMPSLSNYLSFQILHIQTPR